MANTKFPLILNGVKFLVNPRSIRVSSPLVYGNLPTQAGIRYQIWYGQPEVITITGWSAGESAYSELLSLKNNFEYTTTNTLSSLYYKSTVYKGFMTNLSVGSTLDAFLRFPYEITFQLVAGETFNIHDLSLEPSGIIGEAQDFLEENINAPIARAANAFNKTLGKII
jgi:hypothetical protein